MNANAEPSGSSPGGKIGVIVLVALIVAGASLALWHFRVADGPAQKSAPSDTVVQEGAATGPGGASGMTAGALGNRVAPVTPGAGNTDAALANPTIPPGELTVKVDQPGAKISPVLFGLTIEEINHSLDGGLYAELLQNRDFSAMQVVVMPNGVTIPAGATVTLPGAVPRPTATTGPSGAATRPSAPGGFGAVRPAIAGAVPGTVPNAADERIITPLSWSLLKPEGADAVMYVDRATAIPGTTATRSLVVSVNALPEGKRVGVANDGYWGIPVKPEWEYHGSFYAKADGVFTGPVTVTIESADGATTYASAVVEKISTDWARHEVTLKTGKDAALSLHNRFVISTASKGSLWLGEASLFPPTFNNRPHGNRIDLMEKLANLHPAFIEFPGGDFMIGQSVATRFNWKSAIGPQEMRTSQASRWERSSNGFGLLEFLETCEDLKAEPVLALYSGTSIGQHIAPGPTLQPYVQDALDEIEYVTGDKSTTWGARRAADGHPDPFTLHVVQVGNNEQLFNAATYDERFTQFYDAIKAKYPALKIIGWMNLATTRTPDIEHESFYPTANDLMADTGHYDAADRKAAVRYKMEFNAKEGDPTKTLYAALADTAWLLGAERNSDAVVMATPAPLFINVNGGAAQHPADLIGYDALVSYGSPAYYAECMFNQNKGDTVLPVELKPQDVTIADTIAPHGAIGVGAWGSDVEYKDIKVTSADGKTLFASDFSKGTDGWRLGTGTWRAENGALHQSSNLINCTAIAGDPEWTDYTLTLKARKNSGGEGFLILVHAADAGNYVWWNIGGWDNTRMAMEQTLDGGKVPLGDGAAERVEAGKWYDIRVEVKGDDIVCILDGAPALTATERQRAPAPSPIFAAASRDDKTGEVIIKVVNASPAREALQINLQGVAGVESTATLDVLAGRPGDVNSIESPEKVAPHRLTLHAPGPQFVHEFPPYSVSVLRIKPK